MKLDRRSLAALACLVSLAACSERVEERDDTHEDSHVAATRISFSAGTYEAAGITVAPAGLRSLVPTIQVTGTLSYDQRSMAIATARIGGRITKVVADYGQRVSAGETLAWIDSPELGAAQTDYLRDESTHRLRKAEYERAELLLEGDAISRGELLRREAEWRAAEAELKAAEQKLHILGLSKSDIEELSGNRSGAGHEYPVRTPIDGRVTQREAVPGRVVSADDELFTVARLESLWLFVQVFEKDLPAVKEGAAVTLTCESHPNERFRGTIDFVGQVLDPHSRTVRARAVIENPDGELKPGMFVYARIEARSGDDAAALFLAIPMSAVGKVGGRDGVFVQTGELMFEFRPVILGEATRDWVEIRSGLTEGEMIAVEGVFILKSELLKGGLEGHDH
jgi:cobalt-zinc-cadmium efflux system membrane fusion protein